MIVKKCIYCFEKDNEIFKLKQQIEQLKRVDAPSWKGKSRSEVTKISETEWKIVTYIKPHKDSEPREQVHYLPTHNVDVVWHLIKTLTDTYCLITDLNKPINGGKHKTNYKELTDALINYYAEKGIDLTEGNEGKLRRLGKHYFDKYLFPLYVLEKIKYIYYPKTIYRLKE